MAHLAPDESDDERSLPDLQLSAVTEAVLAYGNSTTIQDSELVEINQEGRDAQAGRSGQHRHSVRIYDSSHPRTEESVDKGWAYGTNSFHVPPKRPTKQTASVPAAPEILNPERNRDSDEGPGVWNDSYVAPYLDAAREAVDPPHPAPPAANNRDIIQFPATRPTTSSRAISEVGISVRVPRTDNHSAHPQQEPAEKTSRNLKDISIERNVLHNRDGSAPLRGGAQRAVPTGSLTSRGETGTPEGYRSGAVAPAPQNSSPQPALVVPSALQASSADGAKRPSEKRKSVRRFIVKGQSYTITRRLGKGGSGRVYEVVSEANRVFALKNIPLQDMDARARKQLENEVSLLSNVGKASRVIYMKEWTVDEARNCMYIVTELGQCDFDKMLTGHMERNPKLDFTFVGYYWLEMLRCLAVVHDLGIVHSDLKPANFVLAKGVLKLIDFGIANALTDDTVNVYQEHLSGTPNYMAPETFKATSRGGNMLENRAFRFGKPSDIWSLGCILYQMIYGRKPFGHVEGLGPKAMAICDPQHAIEYGAEGLGGVKVPQSYIRTMRACLTREAPERPTAGTMLKNPDGFLQSTDNDLHVTSGTLETVFTDAIRQAGTSASPEEIEAWAKQVMERLENNT